MATMEYRSYSRFLALCPVLWLRLSLDGKVNLATTGFMSYGMTYGGDSTPTIIINVRTAYGHAVGLRCTSQSYASPPPQSPPPQPANHGDGGPATLPNVIILQREASMPTKFKTVIRIHFC
ncbi:hypothetical protein GGR56DRAFT_485841 [Xylariaceae sp. FL0804]|nr:hypothetical protein GGR56DRAFT_485841 [Xylariaceae sp. FL0804]